MQEHLVHANFHDSTFLMGSFFEVRILETILIHHMAHFVNKTLFHGYTVFFFFLEFIVSPL